MRSNRRSLRHKKDNIISIINYWWSNNDNSNKLVICKLFAYTRALLQFFDAALSHQSLDTYLLHLTLSASLRLGVKIHPQISLIFLALG